MKRFLIVLTIALACLSLFAATAEAKRFGGGGSFGKQRSMAPQQAPKAPATAPAPTPGATPAATPAPVPATTPAPAGNKWLGPLAGLAIGAGLGALFAGGLGGAMVGIMMVILAGIAVMFLISLLRKKQSQPAMQYAGAGAPYHEPQPAPQPVYGGSTASVAAPAAQSNIPADFPVENFLHSAKTSFIRLQAANDRKDLDDIREYTTPEMFAEISMQMRERDNAPQKTDVLEINGELLEVVNEGDYAIASVRFTGRLRENNGTPDNVDEIWHV
ncbi:MAG: TIM44-like domain-containing protein, partial [Betaproteobacteria bacterium]|nr:TIM44-like domain-containing protein [Betaproteobacteria bacterium]